MDPKKTVKDILKENSKTYWLGYSIRDAFIDYIIKNKNLSSKIDDRFIK